MPREVVLPPVEADLLELAWRLFPEHRERRGEPAVGGRNRSESASGHGETGASA